MLVAQALAEFGAIVGALSSSYDTLRGIAAGQIQQVEPTTWVAIIGAGAVLWRVFTARR